jgi:hypothetical protein
MAVALRHIGIVVSNMEQALNIYEKLFGCEVVKILSEVKGNYISQLVGIPGALMKIAILKTKDNNRIELIEYLNITGKKRVPVISNDIGASHFAITVVDIDKLYNQSADYSIHFLSPPLLSPDGYVKVAYAIIMEECLVEIVEVLDVQGEITGGN